jgi:hypothetical protein
VPTIFINSLDGSNGQSLVICVIPPILVILERHPIAERLAFMRMWLHRFGIRRIICLAFAVIVESDARTRQAL